MVAGISFVYVGLLILKLLLLPVLHDFVKTLSCLYFVSYCVGLA